jgi:membrane protein DedA with SNARE-associated domain
MWYTSFFITKKLLGIHTQYAILNCHPSMNLTANILSGVPDLVANGGYGLLLAAVFFEALPLIGSLIPGHVILLSAGFFAKLGILDLASVLAISASAAILGDMVSFFLGKRWGNELLYKFGRRLYLKPEYIERTKSLIHQHTRKAIVFGKFSPITRPFMAFIIGSNHVHHKTFLLYNIIGGVLWTFASVIIGYLFGASYPFISQYIGQFIFTAIIVSILMIWGYRVVNRQFHVFKRYELFMLGLNLLSLWVLLKTIQDSLSRTSFLANFDIYVSVFMHEHVTPAIIKIAAFLGYWGDTEAFFALGLVIGFAFLLKNKWRRAGVLLLSVSSTAMAVQWAKAFFMRARPENAIELAQGASFPSGHASLSAAFFIACLYVFVPRINSWILRELFIVVCVVTIIVVGLSRVILNVHWASDVIAGWSLGIFLATASVLFIRYAAAVLLRDTK